MSIKKKAKKFQKELIDVISKHLDDVDPEVILYMMSTEMIELALASSNDDPHVALNNAFGAMQIVALEKGYNLSFQDVGPRTVH